MPRPPAHAQLGCSIRNYFNYEFRRKASSRVGGGGEAEWGEEPKLAFNNTGKKF